MIDRADAIISLRPTSNFIMRDDNLEWLDTENQPPTEEEIAAEIIRLQAEYDSKKYQRDRASKYPPFSEQLDMLYHDKMNNTDNWLESIQAVKNRYPKN